MGVGDLQELAPLRRITLVGLHRAPRPVGVRERELRSGVPLAFELLHAEPEHLARLLDLVHVGCVEAAEVAIGERPRGRRSAGLERAPEEALGLRQAPVVDVLPGERPVGARRHLARDVVGQHLRRLEQDALLGLQDVPDVPLLLRVGHAREIGDVPEPHLGQLLYDLPQLLPLLAELGRPVAAPGKGEARSGDEEGERAHDAPRLAIPRRVLLGRGHLEELRAPAPELHVELDARALRGPLDRLDRLPLDLAALAHASPLPGELERSRPVEVSARAGSNLSAARSPSEQPTETRRTSRQPRAGAGGGAAERPQAAQVQGGAGEVPPVAHLRHAAEDEATKAHRLLDLPMPTKDVPYARGPNSAAGRRGRRRSAYEAPRAAADRGTRLGGAESKRRRRPPPPRTAVSGHAPSRTPAARSRAFRDAMRA